MPESVDDVVFARLLDGLDRFLSEVRDQPDHPLRTELDRNLVAQVRSLSADGSLSESAVRLKDDLMVHPPCRLGFGACGTAPSNGGTGRD